MDDALRAKLQSKISDFRNWTAGRDFHGCRLVHYCGIDLVGVKSLSLLEVETEIEGLVCEAYCVDWSEHSGCLYLRVWEFGGPEPDWQKVFAEEPLADIEAILHEALEGTSPNS